MKANDVPENNQFTNQIDECNSANTETYNKLCQEFIKMKNNYERVQNAQMALRNVSLEQSSLDNLIKASLNPLGARPRFDSLRDVRHQHFARKRAMTVDGPVREKCAALNHTQKSAFVSFKQDEIMQEVVQDTKDGEENSKDTDLKLDQPSLNKKRTLAAMQKDFASYTSPLLLSSNYEFSGRKKAKSL
jgi:histone acetyltransferase (RNA polymerase elongator complex component)